MSEKEIFSIDLDSKEFIEKLKVAGDWIEKTFSENGSLDSFKEGLEKNLRILGLLGAALLVTKTAIEEAFEAERIEQVNRQFNLLTEAAGISGDALKSAFLEASEGLLSTHEATELANKSIVKLGASAKRLPEIMELSRKIGTITGKDITQSFTEFSDALASGNLRALRQYGIIVDQKKALQDYARELGVSTDALSRQGQVQAIINAALEQGEKRYSAVETGSDRAKESFERLKASLTELKDLFTSLFTNVAPLVADVFEGITGRVQTLAHFLRDSLGIEASTSAGKVEDLTLKVNGLKDQLFELENAKPTIWDGWFGDGEKEKRIKSIRDEIVATEAEINGLQAKANEARNKAKEGGGSTSNKEDLVDRDRQLKEEQRLQEQLYQIREQSLQTQLQQAQTVEDVDRLHSEQKILIEQEFQLKKEQLEREAREKNIENDQIIEELENQKNLQLQQMDQQLYEDRLRALDNYQRASENTAQGIARSFEVASKKAALDLQKGIGLGNSAVNAFSKNSTQALLAFGAGTKSAGEAFKGFLYGAIADTAQAFGEQMLLASLFPPNPIGLAAGAGLIALSGFLRSQSKGASDFGGGSFGGGGGSGGGGATAGGASLGLQQQESKAVSITVQGSYFETEQTRTRLVDMIRESSDFTDFRFRQIGQ